MRKRIGYTVNLTILVGIVSSISLGAETKGVIFRCDTAQKTLAVEREMLELLNEFGFGDLMEKEKNNPNEIVYYLRRDPRRRYSRADTLHLRERPELRIEPQNVTIRTSRGKRKEVDLVTRKEILAAMLVPGRENVFEGARCNVSSLREMLSIRQKIVLSALKAYWRFPSRRSKFNPEFWDPNRNLVEGKDLCDAIDDVWDGPVNTEPGCTLACGLFQIRGLLVHYKDNPEAIAEIKATFGNDPFGKVIQISDNEVINRIWDIPDDNWIPGDWGWFRNDYTGRRRKGEEGKNVTYGGGGTMVPYYVGNPYLTPGGCARAVYNWRPSSQRHSVSDGDLVYRMLRPYRKTPKLWGPAPRETVETRPVAEPAPPRSH